MLDVRLARLALPLPFELAIRRALVHPERTTQHEGLVLAWELGVRILAGSLWAACRAIGANSSALESIAAKLDRPSLGHWVELGRTSAALLRGRTEPHATAFLATLDGLDQPLPTEGGLAMLAGRIAALPSSTAADRARKKPRRIQELLDLLPHYRNEAQSTHGDVPSAFREASVAALLEGLVEFCERVPLLGEYTLIFVRKLERAADGHVAEIARLHGNSISWAVRKLDPALWEELAPARPYLFREPDLVLPLFPMAAVTSSGAEWHVGWYARQVHAPTVAYQGVAGQEFQLVLAPDELAAILRGAKASSDAASADFERLDPYRGLLVYEEEHAAIFFGREEETEAAVARIEERGALFVYGASGSGKSSWLRAGIVPALRAKAALAGRVLKPIVVLPGEKPLSALRRALTSARGGTPEEAAAWARAVDDALPERGAKARERALAPLLRGLGAQGAWPVLLVDQLEEAALSAIDRAEGRAFLELVAGAAASAMDVGAVVLASARADLLAPLIEHASLRRLLQEDGWPIGSIPLERLARVIVEPLRGRKVGVEPGLAETIVGDISSEPGALALLSQVLTTLWDERERFGGALTRQGYVDAGRVTGALEKQAEAALAELCAGTPEGETELPDGRTSLRGGGTSTGVEATRPAAATDTADARKRVDRLFRALAQSDEGERFTRRRVKLSSLASELALNESELRLLVAPFVKRRLVVLGGDGESQTAEVAHERLLDAWPRLKTLLASEREVLALRREVESASAAWESSSRKREHWTDGTSKLRRSEELVAAGRLDLDARGRAFLVASRAGVRRRKRIERTALAALGVLALTACVATWIAYEASVRAVAVALEASRLKDAALDQNRELRVRGLSEDLAAFGALDDTLDYARSQELPASEWWLQRAHHLVEGVQEDPVAGTTWSPGLADAEARLVQLRDRALPLSEAERDKERASDPRAKQLVRMRARLQWQARMLGMDAWPTEAEAEARLSKDDLSADANSLNSEAWNLVDPDVRTVTGLGGATIGRETEALVLARRAVATASDEQLPLHRDTLAWALLWTGHFDEALAMERKALEELDALGGDLAQRKLELSQNPGRIEQEALLEEFAKLDALGKALAQRKAQLSQYLARIELVVGRWRGRELDSRRDEHEALVKELAGLESESSERRTWRFTASDDQWWHQQLSGIVRDLGRLERQSVIAKRSVSDAQAALWKTAIEAIAETEQYRGVRWPSGDRLTPQLGLVPIGPDPTSGLWEFSHLESGEVASRAADRTIVLEPGMGLVFVLLPGGRVPVEEGEHVLQDAELTKIDLDPFFLSKYELTNGQWDRLGDWRRASERGGDPLLPVVGVSWDDCTATLSRSGEWGWLPTEAQWEYGCRAGTPTPWWTGKDMASLRGAANIEFDGADQTPGLQRVGQLRANPWGLHDVHGNVWEWCRDAFGSDESIRQPGDGFLDELDASTRVLRGGTHWFEAGRARSSWRGDFAPSYRSSVCGLRPARGITP